MFGNIHEGFFQQMATADWFVVQGQALQTASNLAGLHPQHLPDPLY